MGRLQKNGPNGGFMNFAIFKKFSKLFNGTESCILYCINAIYKEIYTRSNHFFIICEYVSKMCVTLDGFVKVTFLIFNFFLCIFTL